MEGNFYNLKVRKVFPHVKKNPEVTNIDKEIDKCNPVKTKTCTCKFHHKTEDK